MAVLVFEVNVRKNGDKRTYNAVQMCREKYCFLALYRNQSYAPAALPLEKILSSSD
jgi:hypothetical protein